MEFLESMLRDVLMTLYEQAWIGAIIAILFMFFYLFAKEKGWKKAINLWWSSFCKDVRFRRMFFLSFYVMMIVLRTLLNREMWINPLCDVLGGWGIYDMNGNITTQAIENVFLFIPFIFLMFWALSDFVFRKPITFIRVILMSISVAFLFSLGIEACQLFFRVGTFQISDLCYNTIGGMVGGIIYYMVICLKKEKIN